MVTVGQWILLSIVVLLGLILLFNAARYILKLAFVVAIAGLIIFGLHRYALLPEPAQKYIDELVSEENVQKVKAWFNQWFGEETVEKTQEDEKNTSS